MLKVGEFQWSNFQHLQTCFAMANYFQNTSFKYCCCIKPNSFSNEASEVVKEQKGYPYSKCINFNATNRIQKDLIGRKTCQGPLFQEATQVKFLQKTGKEYAQAEGRPGSAPVLLEGLLKHGWPHPQKCCSRYEVAYKILHFCYVST